MAKAAAHTAQHAKKHAVSKVPHGNGGARFFGKIGRFFRNTRLEMKKWVGYSKKDSSSIRLSSSSASSSSALRYGR